MKRAVSNNKGQFVIETVLMMIVTISVFLWATNQLRESKFLAKMIAGPWQKVSGMIEAGVWDTPDKARQLHPNQIDRSLTVKPN
ncbi:hypothetical protein QJS83_08475 [Bdellovibrio sp. 22V]|uniref:hypothetical protein n=1 Tax=Bdellovibrio TaxID=958 RepID=UPI002542DEB4|nr:hypothetical protein [Bdellovibrio sp. 22V]WII73909.1 hypothetical protein QJS83_08475 [Bdellovibrio sp. 22V]